MTHIYDLPPAELATKVAINAERSRQGLPPLCFNRPDFPPPMSPDCKSWAVHPHENPGTESIPAREGWRCWSCRHLPSDSRVITTAAASELSV